MLDGFARLANGDADKAITALRQAKPFSQELGDYVDFYLASAYRNKGSAPDVVLVLDGYDKRYPDSLFRREANLLLANALMTEGAAEKAIAVLEADRKPVRSDLELALGKANAALGRNTQAAESFRKIYYEFPLSQDADDAGIRLRTIVPQDALATRELRMTRAGLLVKGRRYALAADEYRQLIDDAGASDAGAESVPGLKVAFANALLKADHAAEAKVVLANMTDASLEVAAQRQYLLAEIARNANDDAALLAAIDDLRKNANQSGWYEQALLTGGNMYLLRKDFADAAKLFDELGHHFSSRLAAATHWKAAWLLYRLGNMDEAKKEFEDQITLFPASVEVSNALYWRGRVAEDEKDFPTSRTYYATLSQRFRNYYYGTLARERLRDIKGIVADSADIPLMAKVKAPQVTPNLPASADGVENIRLERSRLLENGALYDLAAKELQSAASDGDNPWVTAELARLQIDAGKPQLAIETIKRAIPNYAAVDISSVPRPVWEALFPRPYWIDLRRDSEANGLDPYLVASLIRQESEFNPGAVSRANAYGLMQLLPSVGARVAKQMKIRPYSTALLLDPQANIRLGTRFFRQMVDENAGKVELALAAYNAGQNRVRDWQASGNFRDVPEFVESIPFTETREYVQAIMRNVNLYKQLYAGSEAADTKPLSSARTSGIPQ